MSMPDIAVGVPNSGELGGAVELSALSLDPIVAQAIAAACQAWIDELQSMVEQCARLSDVRGMGTLQSGLDLARKFSLKAVGGDDSLESVLRSHIAVVTEMRDFFQKCVDRYQSVDASNATTLTTAETPK
ncbi:hypothetical protein [Rhodococcus sp. ARC_M6]|uniref:hypothetical protein n=1 Tax=Rhodococcus sp. ARC_M6 TaxID=2928852 RepID=UPI001FB4E3A3|nr:hypothetical protein [Rhodococcus sp. ARC_M6]MCJ0906530.1 hypothetical protein [Rhodococcus sp. ARC_M6]